MAKKKKAVKKYPRRMLTAGIPNDKYIDQYPWKNGDFVTILGELANMPSHYVIECKGLVYSGYHDDFFVDIPE